MSEKRYKDPRVNFRKLKQWVLEQIYDDYRASIPPRRSPFNRMQSLANIADGYENVFERPIENLMLAVILIVLGTGEEKWESYFRGEIEKILSDYDLSDLLEELESDERSYFRVDLQILGYAVPDSRA